jgi:hypothetical protein
LYVFICFGHKLKKINCKSERMVWKPWWIALMSSNHDIWKVNAITRREIESEHIDYRGFQDIREGVSLRRVGCIWLRNLPQKLNNVIMLLCWTQLRQTNLLQCFLEGKGLGIQQGTNVWVGSPKSLETLELKFRCSALRSSSNCYTTDHWRWEDSMQSPDLCVIQKVEDLDRL